MIRIFFVGAGLVGIAFIFTQLLPGYARTLPPPDPLAAGGSLSPEAVRMLERAEEIAIQLVREQNSWKAAAFWLSLGALACTTLATLVAAFRAKDSRKAKEKFLNDKITTIGALSAVATLLTTGGELVGTHRVDALNGGISKLKSALVTVPADIAANPTQADAILSVFRVTLSEFDG